MEVKTIAFYNWQYPGGGGETVTRNLGCFFRSRGCRVIIYTSNLLEDILEEQERDWFTFRPLPDKKEIASPQNTDFLCQSLADEQVDCIIVQGATQLQFAAIRDRVNCKIIFCLHSIPLWEVCIARSRCCSEISNPTMLRKLEFLLLRKPINLLTNKLKRRYTRMYAGILRHTDRLVTLCPEYQQELMQLIRKSDYPGHDSPEEKFMSIPNPLQSLAEPVSGMPKEKVVLYVGRLVRGDKRVDRLLTIWKYIEQHTPIWRLIVLGRGPAENSLRQQAARLGLKQVEFAGHQLDVASYYRRASFICLTSNFEGLPMCLVEAQQYGVIPVSFDSFASIREITDNGESGIMVPAYDLRAYARMLNDALSDTQLQERIRTRCYTAAQRYNLEIIGEQWLRLFDKL